MRPTGTLFRRLHPHRVPGCPQYMQASLYGALELPAGLRTDVHYPLRITETPSGTTLHLENAPGSPIGREHEFTLLHHIAASRQWRISIGIGADQSDTMVLRNAKVCSPIEGKQIYLAVSVIGTHEDDAAMPEAVLDFVDGFSGPPARPPVKTAGRTPDQVLLDPVALIHGQRVALETTLAAEAHDQVLAIHAALNTPAGQRTEQQLAVIQQAEASDVHSLPRSILLNRRRDPDFDRFCIDRARQAAAKGAAPRPRGP